jgi:NAD(P)-dependent dehydrogenase (short-subunit alcohol dehydrogenase family)
VTGANRGFGAACVAEFAEAGWDVIAVSRSPQPASTGRVRQVQWDVTDDDTAALSAALGNEPLDLLVSNAGAGTPGTPLEQVDIGTLLRVTDVNVGGVLRATRAARPNLLLAGAPLVVNVSSRLGSVHDQAAGRYRGYSTSYAYRISKAAQNMATVCLAGELGPAVRVWAIHPGRLATGMGRADAAEDPRLAAGRLRALADSSCPDSPRFLNLAGGEIAW